MQYISKAAFRAFLVAIGLTLFVVVCFKSAQNAPNPEAISGRPYLFPTHPLVSIATLANTTSPSAGQSSSLSATTSNALAAAPVSHTTPAAPHEDFPSTSSAHHAPMTHSAMPPAAVHHRPISTPQSSPPAPHTQLVPKTQHATSHTSDDTSAARSLSRLLF